MAALNDGATVQLSELLTAATYYESRLEQAGQGWPHDANALLAEEYCRLAATAYDAAARVAEQLGVKGIAEHCDAASKRLLRAEELYHDAVTHARKVYGMDDDAEDDPS